MSEKRADTPVASRTPADRIAPAQPTRKPFVRPSVQDLGGLALVTLVTSIPVGP